MQTFFLEVRARGPSLRCAPARLGDDSSDLSLDLLGALNRARFVRRVVSTPQKLSTGGVQTRFRRRMPSRVRNAAAQVDIIATVCFTGDGGPYLSP